MNDILTLDLRKIKAKVIYNQSYPINVLKVADDHSQASVELKAQELSIIKLFDNLLELCHTFTSPLLHLSLHYLF